MMINSTNSLYNYSMMPMYNAIFTSQQIKYAGNSMFKPISYAANQSNYMTASGKAFISDSKAQASDLLDSINNLLSAANNKGTVSAQSSNNRVVSVQSNNSTRKADPIDMQVHQVATTQKNTSTALDSQNLDVAVGNYDFEIETGGSIHQFSITVDSTDTNESVQEKMAAAINSADIGVNALVRTNANTNASTLTLESAETGRVSGGQQFEIRDVGSDTLISQTGADQISQYAVDAKYTVNGELKTSSSNEVSLGNGITATLKRASDKEVTISTGSSKSTMANAVKDLVSSFNALLETAQSNSGDKKTQRLINGLANTSKTYASTLKKVGIEVSGDGSLKINKNNLKKSIEDGSLQKFLERESKSINYGFTQRVSTIAKSVEQDPTRYISKDSFRDMNTSTFMILPSSLYGFGMGSTANTGLLFETLF